MQKEGTHPVVYPAAGSHATFYDSAVYVENGQHGSGLGCDNTTEPLRELKLAPVLMPNGVTATGPFAWTSYYGRWGEREKGYNNGPTGPQTKHQWHEPFAWMAAQRTTSPRLPGGTIAGPQVTKAFCGVVATASEVINLDAESPFAAAATVIGLVLLIALFVFVTRWRPVDIDTLRRRRALGQILRAARQFYGRHWRVLLPVALAALVLIGATNALAVLITNDSNPGRLRPEPRLGRHARTAHPARSPRRWSRRSRSSSPAKRCATARSPSSAPCAACASASGGSSARQLLATLGVLVLAITVIGLPFALRYLVGWSFVQQEVLFTDKGFRESFRGSVRLVRGRWFRTRPGDSRLLL